MCHVISYIRWRKLRWPQFVCVCVHESLWEKRDFMEEKIQLAAHLQYQVAMVEEEILSFVSFSWAQRRIASGVLNYFDVSLCIHHWRRQWTNCEPLLFRNIQHSAWIASHFYSSSCVETLADGLFLLSSSQWAPVFCSRRLWPSRKVHSRVNSIKPVTFFFFSDIFSTRSFLPSVFT